MMRLRSVPRQLLPLAVSAGLAGAIAVGAALAQPYGGPPRQPGGDVQTQLASLHAALHISPAEEPAWRAFAAASQPDPQAEARARAAHQMLPKLTAPQRVDLSVAAMQADLDSLRQRGAALKTFYASLTPEQQQVFDRQTLPPAEPEGAPE